ncbi:MAG: 1-acyl-sn-glycerol-3-phosphate acyltransferase [Lachnospiraceae bacterium]|nr:1-acyl-sn-glycerol-3-phosphate acyltransferase [Lachnospiraceae bacterium]
MNKIELLSYREERLLSTEKRQRYYEELRSILLKRKTKVTTPGALTIAPRLKWITGKIAQKVTDVLAGGEMEFVCDGTENIPNGAVIFACTHQGIMDNFVWIPSCPRHCVILHAKDVNKLLILAQINTGLILVDRKDVESRKNAKLDMIHILLKGNCIRYFPEGAWNLSPNKLHLPMSFGFLEVAQKARVPIVPVVTEHTYDTTRDRERIVKTHIRYGKAINVEMTDDLNKKLVEYEEAISTIRWELIAEKGLFSRSTISNMDYINYIKGNLYNLELGNKSLEGENSCIRGANSEFYKFHHINNVLWDEWGNLCYTKESKRLKDLRKMHGI